MSLHELALPPGTPDQPLGHDTSNSTASLVPRHTPTLLVLETVQLPTRLSFRPPPQSRSVLLVATGGGVWVLERDSMGLSTTAGYWIDSIRFSPAVYATPQTSPGRVVPSSVRVERSLRIFRVEGVGLDPVLFMSGSLAGVLILNLEQGRSRGKSREAYEFRRHTILPGGNRCLACAMPKSRCRPHFPSQSSFTTAYQVRPHSIASGR